ncbi:MAG TPA: hypothetical protein VF230_06480 [Acidimicrobiales bacterium]
MSTVRARSRWPYALLAVVVVAATISAWLMSAKPWQGERVALGAEGTVAFDPSDPAATVVEADDIFFGRVVRLESRIGRVTLAEEQYQVEVTQTIKGRLSGDVVVSVLNPEEGIRVGDEYFFATRPHFKRPGWHTTTLRDWRIPITSAEQRAELVADYTAALTPAA